MIRIITLLLIGCFIFGCASKAPIAPTGLLHSSIPIGIETPKPACRSIGAGRSENLDFNNNLNRLIKQLGDYDYKKQEFAYQEILSIADKIVKSTASNSDYNSPNLDYLISALEYASKNGCPPDSGSAVNAAIQIRAEKLYNSIKYSAIIHPDLIKLYPGIISLLQKGEEKQIIDWLSGQSQDIQKKAIQFYKYALKSTTPAIRHDAIGCLIKLSGIKHILPLLESEDKEIRMEVISIIANVNDPSVIPYLFPLLKHKDGATRMRTTAVILKLGGSPIIKDVASSLADNDNSAITEMVSFIKRLEDKSSVKDLFPLLKYKHEWLRRETVQTILRLGGTAVIKDIIPSLGDNVVKYEVMGLISNLRDKSSVGDLLPLLQNSDKDIWCAAATKISELEGKTILKHLLPLLKDNSTDIKLSALRFLANNIDCSDKFLVEDILPLLNDSDPDIRNSALTLFIRLGVDKSIVKKMLPLLKDNDEEIRLMVIYFLRGLQDKSFIKDLLPLLKDSNNSVRLTTIEALVYLGGQEIIKEYSLLEELLFLVKGNDKWIKPSAIELLIKMEGAKAIEQYSVIDELLPLFQIDDKYLKSRSIIIAGQFGPPDIIKKILPFLKETDTEVKLSAAWALTQFNDIRAIPIWIEYVDEHGQTLSCITKDGRYYNRPITDFAIDGLRKLTCPILDDYPPSEKTAKFWKEWWKKEGKTWYEEEVKKIATTDEH